MNNRVHAFGDDALGDADAVGLVDRLHAGEVTPRELTEAAIERIGRVDKALGAVAVEDFDTARTSAAARRPGFFSGVPTLLKDNVDLAGVPTQHGTDAFVAPPAPRDGDVARLFSALGTVVLGKTRLSEYGFSGACDHPRQGPVRTPWNLDHYAGASSAGAGALVAAGAVPFAHANDGGGSIRIPAAANGLVGLKPTRGRTPSDPRNRQMPVRIVADGVVTRTVRDTAAFLRETERVYRPRRMQPVGDVRTPLDRPLRVLVVTHGVGRRSSAEMEQLTLSTASRLEELGHRIEVVEKPPVPEVFADAFLLYWSMLSAFLVGTGPREHGDTWRPDNLDNLTLGLARHCRRQAYALPAATAALAGSQVGSRQLYRSYDVVLTPTVAHVTPQVGHLDPSAPYEQVMERLLDWVAFTPLQNATGDPAISLPLATSASGLPVGMQFAAGWGREALLLRLALQLEEAVGFARITG